MSTRGDWDSYIRFFARGIDDAAQRTHRQMLQLVEVQHELKDRIRASNLRADGAHALVDFAIANVSFTVRRAQEGLKLSYGRANKLVGQLADLEILESTGPDSYKRRFYSPSVVDVLTAED